MRIFAATSHRLLLRRIYAFSAIMLMAGVFGTITPAQAQTAICENPNGFCNGLMTQACFRALGAGAIAASENDCPRRLQIYRECLSNAALQCGERRDRDQVAQQAAADCTQERELALFNAVKDSGDATELRQFLAVCPESPLGGVIRSRLAALDDAAAPAGQSEVRAETALVSPGFDCGKASAAQDKIICSDGRASQAEASLNEAWRAVRAATKDKNDKLWALALESQRDWVRARYKICAAAEGDVSNPARFGPVADCLAALAEARTLDLRRLM